MPSLVEGESREAVKRAVPKQSNKIHAAAIARLYVAYPDRHRWTYTGLQGAVVLANDLVGHTFWLKMVDVSPSNRGVIWDQEIYENFQYNQDRIFFHTFELEGCLAGLSFVDDKEAKQFKKKMDEREKNAHRNTRSRPFGASQSGVESSQPSGKSHGIFGGFGRNLLGGHRHSSASHAPQAQSIIPPREIAIAAPSSPGPRLSKKDEILSSLDPKLLQELKSLGLSEDQLVDNADFIQMYVEQRQQDGAVDDRRASKAPPPPQPLTPQDTGNTSRGPPPAPPPARRGGTGARPPSPPADEPDSGSRGHHSTFKVPIFSGAGKFASDAAASSPSRRRADSGATPVSGVPGPPPPPRPPKTPLQDEEDGHVFGVPPPFEGQRKPVIPNRGPVPPPPPARSSGPPPPPPRGATAAHAIPPPLSAAPPPLPPKTPNAPSPAIERHVPPPPPNRETRSVPPPPPLPTADRSSAVPPPPPPPPQMLSSNGPPPPPPMMGGPPPPPPPPPGPALSGMAPVTANAPALPAAGGDRGGLLADIRGGARLKKVSAAEKNDRSQAAVPGGASGGATASGSAPAAGGDSGGLAGALASALAQRKAKVSHSDDEDDKEDW